MAFAEGVGGERYNLRQGNAIPKRGSTTYLAATPPPTKWHLVKQSTAGNDQIDHCVAGDPPLGYIFSVTGGIDMATVLQFRGCFLYFEYNPGNNPPARGDRIVAEGTIGVIPIGGFLRDRVKKDNVNGIGTVVNVDEYAVGVVGVQFL